MLTGFCLCQCTDTSRAAFICAHSKLPLWSVLAVGRAKAREDPGSFAFEDVPASFSVGSFLQKDWHRGSDLTHGCWRHLLEDLSWNSHGAVVNQSWAVSLAPDFLMASRMYLCYQLFLYPLCSHHLNRNSVSTQKNVWVVFFLICVEMLAKNFCLNPLRYRFLIKKKKKKLCLKQTFSTFFLKWTF